jgi:DNA-binding transcriptional LysR family regulator
MLDNVSLDQLRLFVLAVEEGSFTGAAKRVRRAQSAVSDALSKLEAQIGVTLFDRSARLPRLTNEGRVLLADARAIIGGVETMKARARGMSSGIEPELAVVTDVLFPIDLLTSAAAEFKTRFPATPLRLYVEAMGGVVDSVERGRATLGVVGPAPVLPPHMRTERLMDVEMVVVAAPSHPLATWTGPIPRAALANEVQLVLTDRSELSSGRDFGVYSSSTWRLADLFAKHAFLIGGLGWGGMPTHAVADDIASGRLVELRLEDAPSRASLTMSAMYANALPPGPAGRWLVDRLRTQS